MPDAPTQAHSYRVEFVNGDSITHTTSTSAVLRPDQWSDGTPKHTVSATIEDEYGSPGAREVVRFSNGGLGPTGLLRELCEVYLAPHGTEPKPDVKFEWIVNHSRHSQAALQSSMVDIALTYEHEEEKRAEVEGWSMTIGLLCYDHFVLAGPSDDPAGVRQTLQRLQQYASPVPPAAEAFQTIADAGEVFHTRGDGSATMHKEFEVWSETRVSPQGKEWYRRVGGTPLEALRGAAKAGAYTFTDRGTFLTAYNAGDTGDMDVFVEGGEGMLNPCSICIRTDESRSTVLDFVAWLRGSVAQACIERYGMGSKCGVPLFTPCSQKEVSAGSELLCHRSPYLAD